MNVRKLFWAFLVIFCLAFSAVSPQAFALVPGAETPRIQFEEPTQLGSKVSFGVKWIDENGQEIACTVAIEPISGTSGRGRVTVSDSAGRSIGTGSAVYSEERVQSWQFRIGRLFASQTQTRTESVVKVDFGDGSSAVLQRRYDVRTGEKLSSRYVEYDSAGNPQLEQEETPVTTADGRTAYQTTVSSYSYEPLPASVSAAQPNGNPSSGAGVASGGSAAPESGAAAAQGGVRQTTVSYVSYGSWDDAHAGSRPIQNTVANDIDAETRTLTITETKINPDGSRVVIIDQIANFTEEEWSSSTPTTRTVTTTDVNGNDTTSTYTWAPNDSGEGYHLVADNSTPGQAEYGRNQIVDENGDRVGEPTGEVTRYWEIETDENGEPVLVNGHINSAVVLTDGTTTEGGLSGGENTDPAPTEPDHDSSPETP